MFVDAHFHTNVYTRFEGALDKALKLLEEHKILVISASCDVESYQQTLDIAKKSNYVLPCFGIHPQVAHDFLDTLDSLDELFDQALAYNEIGLDHYHLKDKDQYPAQYTMLEHFFKKARDQSKLVVLHLDGAEEQGWELIRKYSLPKVIIHGYKGSLPTMKKLLDVGCYFSVGGNMILDTFKPDIPNDDWNLFHEIVGTIPLERLLVESDGPCRTERNPPEGPPRSMPTYLFTIIEKIAKIRKITPEKITAQSVHNCLTIFKDNKWLQPYTTLFTD